MISLNGLSKSLRKLKSSLAAQINCMRLRTCYFMGLAKFYMNEAKRPSRALGSIRILYWTLFSSSANPNKHWYSIPT